LISQGTKQNGGPMQWGRAPRGATQNRIERSLGGGNPARATGRYSASGAGGPKGPLVGPSRTQLPMYGKALRRAGRWGCRPEGPGGGPGTPKGLSNKGETLREVSSVGILKHSRGHPKAGEGLFPKNNWGLGWPNKRTESESANRGWFDPEFSGQRSFSTQRFRVPKTHNGPKKKKTGGKWAWTFAGRATPPRC